MRVSNTSLISTGCLEYKNWVYMMISYHKWQLTLMKVIRVSSISFTIISTNYMLKSSINARDNSFNGVRVYCPCVIPVISLNRTKYSNLTTKSNFGMCIILVLDMQDIFTNDATGCIPNNFKIEGPYNLYVEMALSGCEYLCRSLHSDTCTLIIFLPNARSCVLLPWRNITLENNMEGCQLVELHYRHRKRG